MMSFSAGTFLIKLSVTIRNFVKIYIQYNGLIKKINRKKFVKPNQLYILTKFSNLFV